MSKTGHKEHPGGGEVKQNIEALIRDFFQPAPEEPERLKELREGIETCIRTFTDSGRITSSMHQGELSYHFKHSEIPENPISPVDYTQYLNSDVIPHGVNVSNPAFIGHMTSQLPLFFQHISRLITVMNQNLVKIETSKVFTLLERQTLGMMHRLVYNYTDDFYNEHIQRRESNLGIMTSCGTLANISALWMARNKALQSSHEFEGLQAEGFTNALKHYGYKDAVVIGSAKMHYSMDKLGSLIGLGAENIIKIGLNKASSIDIGELEDKIIECQKEKRLIVALVGIGGATETGQIDDLEAMGKAAQRYGIHFHVDAAWGGPILFSEKNKHLLKGIELADTVTICGHKQLYLPQGISLVLCKDPLTINHIKATARYQARKESYDLGKHSPEGSRPAVCINLHAGLHLLGKNGYGYLIDEGIRKAALFAEMVKKHPAFELMGAPTTNIVVYRYIPEELRHKTRSGGFAVEEQYIINSINEVLQDEQFLMGHSFISRTSLIQSRYGKKFPLVVLRAVIANPLTTVEHMRQVLEDQVTTGDVVFKQRSMSFSQVLQLLFQQTSSFDRQ